MKMGDNKDIGAFLKEKLETAKKEPDNSLWERINDSLDKKKKKRGVFFLIGKILIIALILVLVSINLNVIPTIELPGKDVDAIMLELENENSKENNDCYLQNVPSKKVDFPDNTSIAIIGTESKTKEENIDRKKMEIGGASNQHSLKNHNSFDVIKNQNDNQRVKQVELVQSNINGENQGEKTNKPSRNLKRKGENNSSKRDLKIKINQIETSLKTTPAIVDSTMVAQTENIEKKLKKSTQKDSTKIEQESKGKWALMVLGGPILYDISKKNSIIDNSLNGMNTSKELTFSYGLGLNFALTDRLSMSYAVLRTKMAYSVKNIPSSTSQELSQILSFSAISHENLVSLQKLSEFNGSGTTLTLRQEIEYIEMPLQFTYSFTQSRFGAHGFVGFSTFLLQENAIYIENSSNQKLKLGNANNLLKIGLGLNAGLGAYYKLSDRITFEINPSFKYHFYISDDQDRNSSGVLMGVYGGIKYNLNLK